MIIKETNKSDFDQTITLIDPKNKNQFNLNQLTTGEIVALWWSSHHKSTSYIPKYFKQIYAIDISPELSNQMQHLRPIL